MTPEQQNWLDEFMDHFDFTRVARAMKSLQWFWVRNGQKKIPEEYEIRAEARRILRMAIDEKSIVSTGGFVAELCSDGLSLKFVLHDYEAFSE